jgi:hypothetical protein
VWPELKKPGISPKPLATSASGFSVEPEQVRAIIGDAVGERLAQDVRQARYAGDTSYGIGDDKLFGNNMLWRYLRACEVLARIVLLVRLKLVTLKYCSMAVKGI